MNIAIILSPTFDPNMGGVQRSTSKLAYIFTELGHDVIIISLSQGQENAQANPPFFYLGSSKDKIKKRLTYLLNRFEIHLVLNQMGFSTSITRLIKKSGKRDLKIVNTLRINPLNFMQNAPFLIADYLQKRNITFVKSTYLLTPITIYHRIKQYLNHSYILNNTDAYVMLSEAFFQELQYFNIDIHKHKKKLFAIPNPFEEPHCPINIDNKENIILYVGRLNKTQKRVDLLMKIWHKLHGILNDWKFWVVGDGPERQWMENYCRINNMTRVRFFGYYNPDHFYEKAKILHLTSAYEGFGNVLVEAQSRYVVPVLFNSYAAAADIIEDGENGLMVPPFDVDDFVEKTVRVATNFSFLKQLSENSYLNAGRFGFETIGKHWNNLFNKIT